MCLANRIIAPLNNPYRDEPHICLSCMNNCVVCDYNGNPAGPDNGWGTIWST